MLPKFLIVDDSKTVRAQIRQMFPENTVEVLEAQDGTEGLDLICQHKPDLILMDFFMPGLNGWEVILRIKADPKLRLIPVVMMSGRKQEVVEQAPKLFEYFELVEKPFGQETLVRAIKSALTKARARKKPAPLPPSPPAPVKPQSKNSVPSGAETQILKAQLQAEFNEKYAKLQAEFNENYLKIQAEFRTRQTRMRTEFNEQQAKLQAEFNKQHAKTQAEFGKQQAKLQTDLEGLRKRVASLMMFSSQKLRNPSSPAGTIRCTLKLKSRRNRSQAS